MAEGAVPHTLILDHVSPATRLLEKRRQMFEVQEALDAQKEEFARREEAFRRREEGLRKKDLDLQESLIRFNKFLQENEAKRNRADKRTLEETAARLKKEADIKDLEKELAECRAQTEKLDAEVQRKRKYERYLQSVQDKMSDEYTDISQLLERHRTLKDAFEDLTETKKQTMIKIEDYRSRLKTLQKIKGNEVMTANNDIATYKKVLEARIEETETLQGIVDGVIDKGSSKTLEIGQVLMAVHNLLQRCDAKRHSTATMHLKHSETKASDSDLGLTGPHALTVSRKVEVDSKEHARELINKLAAVVGAERSGADVPLDADDLMMRGQLAMAALKRVEEYIRAFVSIERDYDAVRSKKSSAHQEYVDDRSEARVSSGPSASGGGGSGGGSAGGGHSGGKSGSAHASGTTHNMSISSSASHGSGRNS